MVKKVMYNSPAQLLTHTGSHAWRIHPTEPQSGLPVP
jgi:hypothetical protein